MTKTRYFSIKKWFETHTAALKILEAIYKVIPLAIIILYPIFAVLLFFESGLSHALIKYFVVPLTVLTAISVLRKIIKKPRPYEVYDTASVIPKKNKGNSFPSRHTASAFIIALAVMSVNIPCGIFMLLLAVLVALSRILAGVHFICDVMGAVLISTVIGIVFFFIF